ncbi:MAG: methylthioribulose 1-phosphate dehydratase [Bacillaceae bacterium]
MHLFLKKWQEITEIKCDLAARDWFYGTSGNLSVKTSSDPLTFLITAENKDRRKSCDDEFIVVNKYGVPVFEATVEPSYEAMVHAEIYKQTDAECVLHVHTVDNNVISEIYGHKGEIILQNNEMLKKFGLNDVDLSLTIPIIENNDNINKQIGSYKPYLNGNQGIVLVKNHGITVWAPSALEAKKRLEVVEFLISYQVKLLMIQGINTKSAG